MSKHDCPRHRGTTCTCETRPMRSYRLGSLLFEDGDIFDLDAAWLSEREGRWPLASQECVHNPGSSCQDVSQGPNKSGICCLDYDQKEND